MLGGGGGAAMKILPPISRIVTDGAESGDFNVETGRCEERVAGVLAGHTVAIAPW